MLYNILVPPQLSSEEGHALHMIGTRQSGLMAMFNLNLRPSRANLADHKLKNLNKLIQLSSTSIALLLRLEKLDS
jgi:hypothetical protein